ncbi:MAG: hypothetical protein IJW21_07505, partial [Clostridia bacterium]|nr:hypothetical protein [Clostridia bacterium]
TPISFEKVTLNDRFWLPRLKTQKETLVPFSLEKTRPAVENLKRIIISNQKKVETIPDLTGLTELKEIYFLEKDAEEIKKHCNPNVKVCSRYNPVDIS